MFAIHILAFLRQWDPVLLLVNGMKDWQVRLIYPRN